VVFLEPRVLYAERGDVDFNLKMELGQARVLTTGTDLTIVALGSMVNVSKAAIAQAGVSADLIDLGTIVPWDKETVLNSVRKSKRLIVVEEAPLSGGWGSEIIATVTKELFSSLVSAPFRITTPDTPVPFNGGLEAKFAPNPSDVCRQILESMKNNSVPDAWWINEGVAK
jgi:pyruvate dehydrogenase E1 component beta subunit